MDTHVRLNGKKMQVNWAQRHMKRIIYHDQIEFIIGMKRWFSTFKITGKKPTVVYINRLCKAY